MNKLVDVWKSWCLEDEMRCIYGTGIEARVILKAVEIVTDSMDLMKLIMTDDTCYNTAE